jgi:hypothetical protein
MGWGGGGGMLFYFIKEKQDLKLLWKDKICFIVIFNLLYLLIIFVKRLWKNGLTFEKLAFLVPESRKLKVPSYLRAGKNFTCNFGGQNTSKIHRQ